MSASVRPGNIPADEVRTLFVTRDAPYPPLSGAPLRNWSHIKAMLELGPVAVFSVGEAVPSVSAIPRVSDWRHHGDARCNSRLRQALSYARRLVRAREFHIGDNRRAEEVSQSLHEFAQTFRPDVTVIENWLDAFPTALHRVGGKIVVDGHNIESRLQSEVLRRSSHPLLIARAYVREIFAKDIERRLFESADEVWVTSEEDAARLRAISRRAVPHRVIPNAVDVEKYDPVRGGQMSISRAVPRQSHSICFVGHFRYEPNLRAANILIDEILPRLRSRFGDARLVLVGREPTKKMLLAAERDSGIVVTGSVDDTRPYLAACDLVVVPLLSGGGTRLKILEAFAAGIPVVSTPVGAEGLDVRDGRQLLIREGFDELVEASAAVWQSSELAISLVKNGYALVSARYSATAVSSKIHAAVTEMLGVGALT